MKTLTPQVREASSSALLLHDRKVSALQQELQQLSALLQQQQQQQGQPQQQQKGRPSLGEEEEEGEEEGGCSPRSRATLAMVQVGTVWGWMEGVERLEGRGDGVLGEVESGLQSVPF